METNGHVFWRLKDIPPNSSKYIVIGIKNRPKLHSRKGVFIGSLNEHGEFDLTIQYSRIEDSGIDWPFQLPIMLLRFIKDIYLYQGKGITDSDIDLGIVHKTNNQNERISHMKEQDLLSENGFEFEQQRYKVVTNPLPTYNQKIR